MPNKSIKPAAIRPAIDAPVLETLISAAYREASIPCTPAVHVLNMNTQALAGSGSYGCQSVHITMCCKIKKALQMVTRTSGQVASTCITSIYEQALSGNCAAKLLTVVWLSSDRADSHSGKLHIGTGKAPWGKPWQPGHRWACIQPAMCLVAGRSPSAQMLCLECLNRD